MENNKRILVTGGAGFLGSHLCDAILRQGHYVRCLDNLSSGSLDNIRHLSAHPRFRFIQQDVSVPFDAGPVDFIFHFASPASPEDYMQDGIGTLRAGSYGTFNALENARKYNAGFLLASTSECYGDPKEHPQTERYCGCVDPVGTRSVYDEAKRFAEAATIAYHRYRKISVRIARIFNTYGPRLRPNDGRVISNFFKQALRGEDLTVYGDGSQTRSFCYVEDTIEGILRLSRVSEPFPVNIGNSTEVTILECARKILDLTGSKSRLRFLPLPEGDPRQRKPDLTKAESLMQWQPAIELEPGLQRCLGYFSRLVALQSPPTTG